MVLTSSLRGMPILLRFIFQKIAHVFEKVHVCMKKLYMTQTNWYIASFLQVFWALGPRAWARPRKLYEEYMDI